MHGGEQGEHRYTLMILPAHGEEIEQSLIFVASFSLELYLLFR